MPHRFPIVGIESAILVEAGFAGEVDAIVMVYAPEEVRIYVPSGGMLPRAN